MILASPPAANSFDAGEKATLRTGCTRPAKECARRPVSLLKTYIDPFSCPEAVKLPLRLYDMLAMYTYGRTLAQECEAYQVHTQPEATLCLVLAYPRHALILVQAPDIDLAVDTGTR